MFVSLAVMAFQLLFAQSFTVKGKVIAEEGNEPLIGVAIMQEGTNNGVITDIDGNYSIEIKGVAQATLVYSYIGMQQQQHVAEVFDIFENLIVHITVRWCETDYFLLYSVSISTRMIELSSILMTSVSILETM